MPSTQSFLKNSYKEIEQLSDRLAWCILGEDIDKRIAACIIGVANNEQRGEEEN